MTQFSLKVLALVCMLCDHVAKVVLTTGVLTPWLGIEGNLRLYTALTVIGRIAFPIFAWFVAEGCRKTKDPIKYILRLLLFALLSEVPFQLCFFGTLELGYHNVIFTLLLGALGALIGKHFMEKHPRWLGACVSGIAVMALAYFLYTDYGAWGVGLILVLFYLPEEKPRLLFLAAWISVFQLIFHGSHVWLQGGDRYYLLLQWLGALTSVLLLTMYHGEKGRGGKWLFYWFYPIHLLLLYGIRLLLLH